MVEESSAVLIVLVSGDVGGDSGSRPLFIEAIDFICNSIGVLREKLSFRVCSGGESIAACGLN